MTKAWIQMAGLIALFVLACALLGLIAYTTSAAVTHITPDGKVPLLDAGQVTAYLLAFQQVVNTMRSIWETQERSALAESLSNSTPNEPAPKTAVAAAQVVADGAQDVADAVADQGVPA